MSERVRNSFSRRSLRVYLLGQIDFTTLIALQRRLVYEIGDDRASAALVLCEHPPTITMGRLASRLHIGYSPEELAVLRWPIHWVNRGAGCLLNTPGQFNMYPILAIDERGWSPIDYVNRLHQWLRSVIHSFDGLTTTPNERSGLWIADRQVAHIGVAIRQWIAYFGAALNVQPDLDLYRRVSCDGAEFPMTSLQRESRVGIRPTRVRQRLIETFAEQFDFDQMNVFHTHPAITWKATTDAVVTRTR